MSTTAEMSAPPIGIEPLLTRRQFAEIVRLHPGSVARLERLGKIKSLKLNARVTRYEQAEVRRFLAAAS